jgi:hypothetical protein
MSDNPPRPPARGVSALLLARMAPQRMTQRKLGAALGLQQSSVSDRLNGRTPWRITELSVAAQVLGFDAAELAELLAAHQNERAAAVPNESVTINEQPPAPTTV